MTREQLQRCFAALPPEVRQQFAERATAFRDYLEKAGNVRATFGRELPTIDPRVAAFLSLAIARFL
ncbi:MAG TPA: hypothetical protein VJV79_02405 [Polyangiaceae bacterium]|nr:hypothetical protein [Polyangiaceae bacterium]